MKFYEVEMDGFSNVTASFELQEGMVCRVHGRESGFYRVRKVEGKKVTFNVLKYLESTEEETKNIYEYDGEAYYFSNRLSKNQSILISGKMYKVLDIVDKKNLKLEIIPFSGVFAVYPVFESRVDRISLLSAEKVFSDWGEAYGYVLQERSRGRKVSL